MAIPNYITYQHVIDAIKDNDQFGMRIPAAVSKKYDLIFRGNRYSPKYIISLASKIAKGEYLDFSTFQPIEAQNYLKKLSPEFIIEPKSPVLTPELTPYIGSNISNPPEPPQDQKARFPLNLILYGPPGTGKTYETIDLSVEIIDGSKSPDHSINKKRFDDLRTAGQIEFITFHQNYAYEDFVVGIRPDPNSEELHFIPHKGIFYRICEQARENYLASRPGQQTQISFDDALATFIKPVVEEDEKVDIMMPSGKHFNIYEVTDRSIKFEKSTGNTSHTLSINTLKELENGNREMISGSGLVAYYQPLIEAIRKRRLIQGNTTPRKRYVLIIDEINRANISRVFGELITLLEDDKRLGGDNELKVMLPNGERNFSIPPNLFVIGTMNTADKSIALLDIALRRRFEFKAIYPDTSLIPQTVREKIIHLNQEIRLAKKSPDYMIGHAFFIGKTDNEIVQVMNAKVIPLLYEYFNGRESIVKDILVKAGFEISENAYTFQWEVKLKLP
jgi:5-methylcytosine-specific restriction protein B